MTQDNRLSDLQIAVMRVLWDRGEVTVAAVHEALHQDRGLALTTVATILTRLEKRELLTHRIEGRQFIFQALVTEAEIRRSMVSELTELLFEGDTAELVSHLLGGRNFTDKDIARVKSLIDEYDESEGGPVDDSK